MKDPTILWHRLDQPGHEAARLVFQDSFWRLSGTAVFVHEQQPCRLDYLVICDERWQTISGRVSGWVGNESVQIEIVADPARRWRLNGKEYPDVAGCLDLDMSFSPSTNLLPIRRLGLTVGQEAEVKAAWLRFPGFSLAPLEQRYHRMDATTYRYESAGGAFVAKLEVNAAGFVTRYPGLWEAETGT